MKRQTIGIVGGMGPLSSIKFYQDIINYCQHELNLRKNNEYPHLLISNLPVPDLITSTESADTTKKMIINELQNLEKAGATIFAIACNTVHLYIDAFRKSITSPIFSIIEETVEELKNQDIKKILLLATPTTIKNNLYQPAFKQINIHVITPTEEQLNFLGNLIPKLVGNTYSEEEEEELNTIIEAYTKQGIDAVILACTELHLGIHHDRHTIPIIDPMSILAKHITKAGI